MGSRFVDQSLDYITVYTTDGIPMTRKGLKRLVKKIVRKCTIIKFRKSSRPPKDTRFISHFGGDPYFEEGQNWPVSKDSGEPLQGVIQIINQGKMHLPDDIGVFQFFWDNHLVENYEIRIYHRLDEKRSVFIPRPPSSEKTRFCRLDFEPSKSLPDWESLSYVSEDASKLSCILNDDEPWEPYHSVKKQLIGEQAYRSQIGGYPQWIQGQNQLPTRDGEDMRLLLQISSEWFARINWVDRGLVYFFAHPEDSSDLEFVMDFH